MQQIGRYTNRASTKEKRRELRNNPTEGERILWKELRGEKFGVKFRRQYNIDYYIVDFYCHELKLVIELDGWVHGEEEQKRKDVIRDVYLKEKGYVILRYTNEQLKYEKNALLQDVYNQIKKLLSLRLTPPSLP